jgi:hypothetical protein
MKLLISLFLLPVFLISGIDLFAYPITQKIGDNEFCKIVHVDDGDTFDLDCTTKYYPNVRLL